jgi:hypothetical protein
MVGCDYDVKWQPSANVGIGGCASPQPNMMLIYQHYLKAAPRGGFFSF